MNLGGQRASVTTGYARIAIASAALDAYLDVFGASVGTCIF
jgi:hypothetical protein